MAIANDRFGQTGHSDGISTKPGLPRHSVEAENVGTNGYARRDPPNGSPRQERVPPERRPGSQQGQKAGAVNGKAESGLEHFASDRQGAHSRRPHGRGRNVARRNRSVGATVRRKVEAVVDVLNLGWGTYLVGLVLIHFLI